MRIALVFALAVAGCVPAITHVEQMPADAPALRSPAPVVVVPVRFDAVADASLGGDSAAWQQAVPKWQGDYDRELVERVRSELPGRPVRLLGAGETVPSEGVVLQSTIRDVHSSGDVAAYGRIRVTGELTFIDGASSRVLLSARVEASSNRTAPGVRTLGKQIQSACLNLADAAAEALRLGHVPGGAK